MHANRLRGALAALFSLVAGAAAASSADALRAGSMEAMIPEIVDTYVRAGLSWDTSITWDIGPFTTTYWYYDLSEDKIIVGAVPTPDEVDAYWQEWSRVLTDGHFDPDDFFASDDEAEELARYNQFVLATHESAHAITYRYDFEHLARHDYAINCREYYADRLTVAILNDEAGRDPDMARWRERYADLAIAMGQSIPEEFRYTIDSFAALDDNCALIDVAQPTPDNMQPYASAYFERYRVLLEADLPPLAEVFHEHLTRYAEERVDAMPLDPERASVEVVNLSERPAVDLGLYYPFEDPDEVVRSRAAAFDAEGTLHFATLTYNRETRMMEVGFGTDADPIAIAEPEAWPCPSARLEITSLAVLSPERFVVALASWHNRKKGGEVHIASWLDITRVDGVWQGTRLSDIEGMQQAVVLRGPQGGLYLLANPDHRSENSSPNWRGLEISTQTGEVVRDLQISSHFDEPIAIDAGDRLYEHLGYFLWRSTPDGADTVLLGNGLGGNRPGPANAAEIMGIEVLQWMADGRALIADRSLDYENWVLREVRPLD